MRSALDTRDAVVSGELTAVEVTEQAIRRIEQGDQEINSFCTLAADQALEDAEAADKALAGGGEPGALHGVPFGVKDLFSTRGVRTTSGSLSLLDNVPDQDAVHVARLKQAGAIVVGKTTTPEFGCKGLTESLALGVTSNPWNPERTAGGSSGGSAAAVAAGLVPIADGGDGAGSIRIPASCCGVFGLKPTFGRVPTYPDWTGFDLLPALGPIASTVADAATMLSAMAGAHSFQPFSNQPPLGDLLGAARDTDLTGVRVGVSQDFGLTKVDAEVIRRLEDSTAALVEAGADASEIETVLPPCQDTIAKLWAWECETAVAELGKQSGALDQLDPFILEMAEYASTLGRAELFAAAHGERDALLRTVQDLFTRYDVIVSPTLALPPFPHPPRGSAGPEVMGSRTTDRFLGWLLTYPFNLTGHPAASVPAGFSSDGLPIGVQVVGRWGAEADVVRASAALEKHRPWPRSCVTGDPIQN